MSISHLLSTDHCCFDHCFGFEVLFQHLLLEIETMLVSPSFISALNICKALVPLLQVVASQQKSYPSHVSRHKHFSSLMPMWFYQSNGFFAALAQLHLI